MAPGQVGAAAVSDKQGVAREKLPLAVKADAAGSVAGRMHHAQRQGARRQIDFVGQADIRLGNGVSIQRMDDDSGAGQKLEPGAAGRVVPMAMGVDDGYDAQSLFLGFR